WGAIIGHASIIQSGNSRMMESGQNILLMSKAADIIWCSPAVANNFNGHLVLKLFIRPISSVHSTHTAFTYLFFDRIGTYFFTDEGLFSVGFVIIFGKSIIEVTFEVQLILQPAFGIQN